MTHLSYSSSVQQALEICFVAVFASSFRDPFKKKFYF